MRPVRAMEEGTISIVMLSIGKKKKKNHPSAMQGTDMAQDQIEYVRRPLDVSIESTRAI